MKTKNEKLLSILLMFLALVSNVCDVICVQIFVLKRNVKSFI